jgi:hypothetical protein
MANYTLPTMCRAGGGSACPLCGWFTDGAHIEPMIGRSVPLPCSDGFAGRSIFAPVKADYLGARLAPGSNSDPPDATRYRHRQPFLKLLGSGET